MMLAITDGTLQEISLFLLAYNITGLGQSYSRSYSQQKAWHFPTAETYQQRSVCFSTVMTQDLFLQFSRCLAGHSFSFAGVATIQWDNRWLLICSDDMTMMAQAYISGYKLQKTGDACGTWRPADYIPANGMERWWWTIFLKEGDPIYAVDVELVLGTPFIQQLYQPHGYLSHMGELTQDIDWGTPYETFSNLQQYIAALDSNASKISGRILLWCEEGYQWQITNPIDIIVTIGQAKFIGRINNEQDGRALVLYGSSAPTEAGTPGVCITPVVAQKQSSGLNLSVGDWTYGGVAGDVALDLQKLDDNAAAYTADDQLRVQISINGAYYPHLHAYFVPYCCGPEDFITIFN